MRHPTKAHTLEKIKALGIPIESIIDIGILTGTGELMDAFRDKKHLLVEPITEWNDIIREGYSRAGVNYTLVNAAASNINGFMNMEISSVVPGEPISHARLTDASEGKNLRKVPVRTIDNLLVEYSLQKPYLLKIDVDGAELLILEGAAMTLTDVNVVIVEAELKNFAERALFLNNRGFELCDIVDFCYYDNRLSQFDMIFMNSAIIKDMDLGMYNKGFDLTKWFDYSASLQNCDEISLNKKNSREVPVSGRPTLLKRAMRYFFPP